MYEPGPTPRLNYYSVLGVPEYASYVRIHQAHRRLVKRYRKLNTPAAHDMLAMIEEASLVLGDEARRRAYDLQMFGPGAKTPSSSFLSLDSEGSWSLLGASWLAIVFGALALMLMALTFIRRSSAERLRSIRPHIAFAIAFHVLFITASLLLLR